MAGEQAPATGVIYPSAYPSAGGDLHAAPADVTSWFDSQPQPEPERAGGLRRIWSRPWVRVGALFLIAAAVVVLVILGAGLAGKHNNGSTPPTTTASTARPTTPTSHVAPITPAQLAQYEGYAVGFKQANEAATRGFASAGAAPTTATLAPVASAYYTAVNLYDFQLRWISWPASMQTVITVDHAQFQALKALLSSFSSVSQTGVSAWLGELHTRTTTAEAADNQLRQDLGLPASTSFP